MTTASPIRPEESFMEAEQHQNHRPDSGALHFELVCDKKDIYNHLVALRSQAQDRVPRVSPIHRLYDNECLIEGPNDPLLDAKLLSQGIMFENNQVVIVNPESITVFAVQLSNRAFVYFGFATYPSSIVLNGKETQVPNSDKAVWSGLLYVKESLGYESYKELYDFVHFLENRGVQVQMNNRLSNLECV
jgi:hypothetical protein